MSRPDRTTPQPAPDSERAFRWSPADPPGTPPLDPWRERDACGTGFVARATGERSHEILRLALTALARLAHRGATAADRSGDGAGVLTQIPRRFLAQAARDAGIRLDLEDPFAVGMLFLPRERRARGQAIRLVDAGLRRAGLRPLGWRDVPVEPATLGARARATLPAVAQVLVAPPARAFGGRRREHDAWERRLYLARRLIERRVAARGIAPFFVCSLSCRTIVYKALLTGTELAAFYPDLASPLFETAIAVFHQRYSTNTLPSWPLAQPFRLLAHNGEINTLWGNRNAMRAREAALASPVWGRRVRDLKPVIWTEGSDSASLDNVLELLVRSGRDPVHALMMLVPEAWEDAPQMDPDVRDFHRFHAALMEPWDGPAAIAFSDGCLVGAALDRSGLRPCRYKVTRDHLVIAGSEVGVADLDPATVVESGRLGPGDVLVVDTKRGVLLHSDEAKREVARRRPYGRWASRLIRDVPAVSEGARTSMAPGTPAPAAAPA
ncbi:MAG TPA: hypothetical protein VNI61_09450, partial [Gemmatimonadales bacterium]|nr:hypothetical protein [Gemmatimonadales bacterium]